MWPTDPYIFSKNVYHFFLGGLSDVWNSGHGETRWCCKQEIRESNKNEDNKRVKINLSLYRKPEEANKKTFSRARFLLIHSLIWSHYFRLLQWIKVLKILIINNNNNNSNRVNNLINNILETCSFSLNVPSTRTIYINRMAKPIVFLSYSDIGGFIQKTKA